MKYSFLSAFLLIATVHVSLAQLPTTHVYTFDLARDAVGFSFKNPRFLSSYNMYGYNNQPHFVNNNELYLSVQFPVDTNQTDLYSLSLINNTITRVTASAESEYSPTLMPDRRNVSCVRVDAGVGRPPVQRLWSYPLDRSSAGKDLLPLTQSIGYHCWLSDKKVALFIVDGAANFLKIASVDDQSSIQLTGGIGRSLARMNDGKLAFVQKATAKTWYIKALDPVAYSSTILTETLPGSEDFVLLPDGTFIMGLGAKLFSFHPADPRKQWIEIADLTVYGLTNIKRLAVSRESDKIAIVNDVSRRR